MFLRLLNRKAKHLLKINAKTRKIKAKIWCFVVKVWLAYFSLSNIKIKYEIINKKILPNTGFLTV